MTANTLLPGLAPTTETMEQVIARVLSAATGQDPPLAVAYLNAHVVALARKQPWLRANLAEIDILLCDGWSLHLATRAAGLPPPPRNTGADWVFTLAHAAAGHGLKLGWWGGAPGRAGAAAEFLASQIPELRPPWTHPGDGDARSDRRVLAAAIEAQVDILLLGLGSPRQEAIAAQLRGEETGPPVLCCLGGTADVLSGAHQRGPKWMTENGLEWIWRLSQEPERLWGRYLVSLPAEALRMGAWAFTHRLRPSPPDRSSW